MGCLWLLRLSAKILALLLLSVNFVFQLPLTKSQKLVSFFFKELNINRTVFLIKVLGSSQDEIKLFF